MKHIALMIIAVEVLICGLIASSVSAQTKIKLLYPTVNAFTASYVAQDQGYFGQHGLDVDLSIAQNAGLVPSALVSDSAQIGGVTPTALLSANEQGLNLAIVAGTIDYPQNPGTAGILAHTGSGIKNATDLVGKKVGIPGFGGIPDVLAKKWVQVNGADFRQVDWVEIAFPQMGDALTGGIIDAATLVSPFYNHIIDGKVGYQIGDTFSVISPGTGSIFFASTREWAAKNSQAIKALRASLDEAVAFIADPTHAASVRDSIAKYTKLPPQAAGSAVIPINYDVQPTAKALTFWIAVSREQGLIKGNPDPASLFAP